MDMLLRPFLQHAWAVLQPQQQLLEQSPPVTDPEPISSSAQQHPTPPKLGPHDEKALEILRGAAARLETAYQEVHAVLAGMESAGLLQDLGPQEATMLAELGLVPHSQHNSGSTPHAAAEAPSCTATTCTSTAVAQPTEQPFPASHACTQAAPLVSFTALCCPAACAGVASSGVAADSTLNRCLPLAAAPATGSGSSGPPVAQHTALHTSSPAPQAPGQTCMVQLNKSAFSGEQLTGL